MMPAMPVAPPLGPHAPPMFVPPATRPSKAPWRTAYNSGLVAVAIGGGIVVMASVLVIVLAAKWLRFSAATTAYQSLHQPSNTLTCTVVGSGWFGTSGIAVAIHIKNDGLSPQELGEADVKLIDERGAEYDWRSAKDYIYRDPFVTLNPGLEASGALVFSVNHGGKYSLKLTNRKPPTIIPLKPIDDYFRGFTGYGTVKDD